MPGWESPYMLWLALLAPVAAWWAWRARRERPRVVASLDAWRKTAGLPAQPRASWPDVVLAALAPLTVAVALAGPYRRADESKAVIHVVVDGGARMAARAPVTDASDGTDTPISRWERAAAALRDLGGRHPGARFRLCVAGRSDATAALPTPAPTDAATLADALATWARVASSPENRRVPPLSAEVGNDWGDFGGDGDAGFSGRAGAAAARWLATALAEVTGGNEADGSGTGGAVYWLSDRPPPWNDDRLGLVRLEDRADNPALLAAAIDFPGDNNGDGGNASAAYLSVTVGRFAPADARPSRRRLALCWRADVDSGGSGNATATVPSAERVRIWGFSLPPGAWDAWKLPLPKAAALSGGRLSLHPHPDDDNDDESGAETVTERIAPPYPLNPSAALKDFSDGLAIDDAVWVPGPAARSFRLAAPVAARTRGRLAAALKLVGGWTENRPDDPRPAYLYIDDDFSALRPAADSAASRSRVLWLFAPRADAGGGFPLAYRTISGRATAEERPFLRGDDGGARLELRPLPGGWEEGLGEIRYRPPADSAAAAGVVWAWTRADGAAHPLAMQWEVPVDWAAPSWRRIAYWGAPPPPAWTGTPDFAVLAAELAERLGPPATARLPGAAISDTRPPLDDEVADGRAAVFFAPGEGMGGSATGATIPRAGLALAALWAVLLLRRWRISPTSDKQ